MPRPRADVRGAPWRSRSHIALPALLLLQVTWQVTLAAGCSVPADESGTGESPPLAPLTAVIPPCAFRSPNGSCDPCRNGFLDGKETDIDCGDPDCGSRCGAGHRCREDHDCAFGLVCARSLCVSCQDGWLDQDETATDCGGSHCDPCSDGNSCLVDRDCRSLSCDHFRCTSCFDQGVNQDETDRDCGGATCQRRCSSGQHCLIDSDCDRGLCVNGICFGCRDGAGDSCETCRNGLRDRGESDVDCGGPCPGCPEGAACTVAVDCAGRACRFLKCIASHCGNDLPDADETFVDCGGPSCLPCSTEGAPCRVNADCLWPLTCRMQACLR